MFEADTSSYGLDCCIHQDEKPIKYTSKALQHEQGYVTPECKALAIAWALEKHHHILYLH